MNKEYSDTLKYMFDSLPMFQRTGQAAYKANLDNTIALDNYFEQPHKSYKTIHVGGTNGKGSSSHMIASVLQESNLKVGLYTSPHLKDFRERIRVDGEKITEDYVVEFIKQNREIFEELKPSFFEMTVFMALNYFKHTGVDIAIIEVGLGGRLDSTNIITPLISVITNISLDHTNLLGNTIEAIAGEKAGIIKDNVPVVIGETQATIADIFKNRASDKNSQISFADTIYRIEESKSTPSHCHYIIQHHDVESAYKCELRGTYQQHNLKTVLQTFNILNENKILTISEKDIKNGIKNVVKNTSLLGRWQKLSDSPLTLCDTGHNVAGIKEILSQLKHENYELLHFVIGLVNDKNIDGVLNLLPKNAKYYFTNANIPRALDKQELFEVATKTGLKGDIYSSVDEALKAAKQNATEKDLIFVGGSTFVVAEVV